MANHSELSKHFIPTRDRRGFLKALGAAAGATMLGNLTGCEHPTEPPASIEKPSHLVKFGHTDLYVSKLCQGTAFRSHLTREGDENRDLYILSKGILEISVKGDDGEVVVGEVQPPEIIGEISFLNGSPRTATITAKTAAEVYILSYYQVEREMSEIPAWFKLILRTLTQRMQSCSTKIKEMEEEVKRLKAS